MADVQLENGFTRIANQLLEAIYSTNFSEPQQRIITFIIRYSYGCNKHTVTLHHWVDLCLAGIPQQKIKHYLHQLNEARVIFLNEDTKTMMLNKNFDQWRISPILGYNSQKAKEILQYNISYNLTDSITHGDKISLTVMDSITPSDIYVSPPVIGSYHPQGSPTIDNSNDSIELQPPKDSIKDSLKTTTEGVVGTNEEQIDIPSTYTLVMKAFKEKYNVEITHSQAGQLLNHAREFRHGEEQGEVVIEAIKRAVPDPKTSGFRVVWKCIENTELWKDSNNKSNNKTPGYDPLLDKLLQATRQWEANYPEIQAYKDKGEGKLEGVTSCYSFLIDILKQFPDLQAKYGHTIEELEAEYVDVKSKYSADVKARYGHLMEVKVNEE